MTDFKFTYSDPSPNEINRAAGQDTWSIDVYSSGEPSRAVDGNFNPSYNGASCMHTNSLEHAWWAVDLGESIQVEKVVLATRDTASKLDKNNNLFMR